MFPTNMYEGKSMGTGANGKVFKLTNNTMGTAQIYSALMFIYLGGGYVLSLTCDNPSMNSAKIQLIAGNNTICDKLKFYTDGTDVFFAIQVTGSFGMYVLKSSYGVSYFMPMFSEVGIPVSSLTEIAISQ